MNPLGLQARIKSIPYSPYYIYTDKPFAVESGLPIEIHIVFLMYISIPASISSLSYSLKAGSCSAFLRLVCTKLGSNSTPGIVRHRDNLWFTQHLNWIVAHHSEYSPTWSPAWLGSAKNEPLGRPVGEPRCVQVSCDEDVKVWWIRWKRWIGWMSRFSSSLPIPFCKLSNDWLDHPLGCV